MAIDIVRTETEDQIDTPFTGQPADGLESPNTTDLTLLFIRYGNAGVYVYIADQVSKVAAVARVGDVEELDPRELAAGIDIPGAFVLKVNAEWNGVNCYAFARQEAE